MRSLKLTIILLFGLFASDRLVYQGLNFVDNYSHPSGPVNKIQYYEAEMENLAIVVLGNSRALHHVDTSKFPLRAINMGADGTQIAYSAALLCMSSGEIPLYLVHIDHNRVFDQDLNGDDSMSLLYKSKSNPELKSFFNRFFRREYIISKIINTYPYNGRVFPMIYGLFKNDTINISGFEPIYPSRVQTEIFQSMFDKTGYQLNINIHPPLEVSPVFDQYVDYMKEKVGFANKSRIVFFTSPSLNRVDDDVKQLTKEYFNSRGLTYLDHIDFFKEFDLSLWKDHTHLSAKGADIYTDSLIRELKKIRVLPTP